MIDGLQPYPAMKDPGVSWLKGVPEHWRVLPNRAIFDEVKERDCPDADLLSVTIARGVIRQEALLEGSSKRDSSKLDKSAYKFVRPGDIVYNKMRAWQGAVGVSTYDGIVSPAYVVQRPRESVAPRYLHYLFRTPAFAKEAERWSYGITSDMWSLRPEQFKMVYSCLPPLSEQIAIVRFLEHVDFRIRRYVRAKQKLIRLLEEQKQAIIHRAVTRGLDPNVLLKPSGVEWLGEIPSHWGVERLKRLARPGAKTFSDGDWVELPFITTSGVRLIQTGNVGRGEYREKGFRFISDTSLLHLRCTEVSPGDVLICRLDGPVGRACLAPDLGVRAITSVDNTILKTRADIDGRFVVYALTSPIWLDWVQSLCRAGGGFRYRVSRSMLGGLQVPVPPQVEQTAISDELDKVLDSIQRGIRQAGEQIRLVQELRTRLIADVVTGKLDAREAAAALPELDAEEGPASQAAEAEEELEGDPAEYTEGEEEELLEVAEGEE